MTSAPPDPSPLETQLEEKPSLAIPLIVWLLIQLAAIALSAWGVQLSANSPRPPQSLAVHVMLVAQFVGAAILLPVLFRGWRAWLAMVLTPGPMLFLAARMTPLPMSRVPMLWVEVAAWMTALAVWRTVASRSAHIIAALAMLLSAGGLVLWYLRAEFQPTSDLDPRTLFPLAATLRRLHDPASRGSPLLSTLAFTAAGLIVLGVNTVKRRKTRRSPETRI